MTEQDIRILLDEAADFLRAGNAHGALSRATAAVAAIELLATPSGDLAAEARLVRDQCALANARVQSEEERRHQKYLAREDAAEVSHQDK